MIVLFVAPKSAWRQALAAETRAAADAGHEVRVVAQEHRDFTLAPLDPRVDAHWIAVVEPGEADPLLVDLVLRRLPLGLLRLLGRGPLRGLADRAARRWRRTVLGPIERRRQPELEALREARRTEAVRAALDRWRPDWIVLHEPHAVELAVHWLPELLDARPDLVTTFSFETRADAAHAI